MNHESRVKVIIVTSDKFEINKRRVGLSMLFSAIAMLVCFILLQNSVFAQEENTPQDTVKKYNITFPISTLGNCSSLEDCKKYCSDVANKEACINFAKSKGFYKEPQGTGNSRARLVIEKAKAELGCTSEKECKEFCAKEGNIQKCAEFAKKYSIENAKNKTINNALLERAKAALGCNSEQECKTFCQNQENREKCSSFAKSSGLAGGIVKVASGSAGFDHIKQIMDKCASDPQFCRENANQIEKQIMLQGDEFCKSNPEKCKEMFKRNESTESSKFMPQSEKAFENANERAKFCREYPEKCRNATGSQTQDKKPLNPNLYYKKDLKDDETGVYKPEVQGVQRVPSFFEWFFNVFLK